MKISENTKSISPVYPFSDEQKLRQLATELARDIHEPHEILSALDLTDDDYEAIKDTRSFKQMLAHAQSEWQSAGNTQKRVKLKSAAVIEESLPQLAFDLVNTKETLNARVGLLTTLAKVAGMGFPEPVAQSGVGNFFKLEIHLAGSDRTIVVGNNTIDRSVIEGEKIEQLTESPLAHGEPFDEF